MSGRFQGLMGGLVATLLAVAACGGGAGAPSEAQFDAEEYFSGKRIKVVTSSSPGGTTDAKARALASHLGRFIPGNPRVQVVNQTPHVAGMNFLWEAPNDGTVIGIEASSTLEFELFEGANWNAAEFRYLGAVDSRCKDIILMRGNLGYQNIEDVRGSTSPPLVTMGEAPDPASLEPMDLGFMLVADWLDLPLEFKPVAESDTAALELAMQRGDINTFRMGQDWCKLPETHPDWISEQYVIPLLDVNPGGAEEQKELAREKLGQAPPHIFELLTEEQTQEWQGIVSSRREGGNPVFLPPGTPDNVTQVLRDAFSEASKDAEFRKAMSQAYGVPADELKWRSADEYTQLIEENRKALYDVKDEIAGITEEMWQKYTE